MPWWGSRPNPEGLCTQFSTVMTFLTFLCPKPIYQHVSRYPSLSLCHRLLQFPVWITSIQSLSIQQAFLLDVKRLVMMHIKSIDITAEVHQYTYRKNANQTTRFCQTDKCTVLRWEKLQLKLLHFTWSTLWCHYLNSVPFSCRFLIFIFLIFLFF